MSTRNNILCHSRVFKDNVELQFSAHRVLIALRIINASYPWVSVRLSSIFAEAKARKTRSRFVHVLPQQNHMTSSVLLLAPPP